MRNAAEHGRRASVVAHALLAAVVFVPLLLTQRGRVVADTKQYLTLDPWTMIEASTSLWDPDWALGTVTHQSIGYLWPMAPFYALGDVAGLPVWVTQRLWLGLIVFSAGAGMLFLGRCFGWSVRSSFVAGAFYALAPYALPYATRMSALIMPWAALPWMVGLAARALRDADGPRPWRDPARLAILITTVGAINASSLIYVGLAVLAWFPFQVWVTRDATVPQALRTMTRIGLLAIVTSAWWAVALIVQGGYGPDVLRFSETLEVVASGSPSHEAWRGLGYWVFYGGDRTGPWVSAGVSYTQNVLLVAVTFVLAVVGLLALLLVRWRHRAYCLGIALLGLLLTIGLHPYTDPSPAGGLITDSAAESTLALALRSSPRALPLFLLAVACSLAVGLDALAREASGRRSIDRRVAPAAAVVVVALSALAIPPLWTGGYVGDELARDETLPAHWTAAADHLDDGDRNGRVVILPGADFSAHRWGNTIDHVLPGLVDRPVAVRELIPYGGAAAADLLIALDRRAQERLLEPGQAAPIARLLGATDVVVQNDLEFERYRTPRPPDLWAVLTDPDAGFGPPTEFGDRVPNEPTERFPMVDEIHFDLPDDLAVPPPVAVLPVPDPLGIVRTRPAEAPLVVAGDGESLVELAGAGLLDPDRVVLYEAALTDDELAQAISAGATLVVTDGNRDRARRWKTIRDNHGVTEARTGDGFEADPTDARLEVFPDAGPASFSTTVQTGVLARSSSYGNPISFHPEDRAFHAVDGDLSTAWRVGTFSETRGEWLDLTFDEPRPADTLHVVQPVTLRPDRWITRLRIEVDGTQPFEVALDERSHAAPGQAIDLGPAGTAPVERMRLTVVEDTAGVRPGYGGLSGVGFAEVWLDDRAGPGAEHVATPPSIAARTAELDGAGLDGVGLDDLGVVVVLARERVDDSSPARDDPETSIRRLVDLPAGGSFTVTGAARLTGRTSDPALDDAVRRLTGLDGGPRAEAERLPGDGTHRTSLLVDGRTDELWRTPIGAQVGRRIVIELGDRHRIGHLDLHLAPDDGEHTRLTGLIIDSDGGDRREVEVPSPDEGGPVRVRFEPFETATLALTIGETDPVVRTDWYAARPVEQPVGIAEIAIPGVDPARVPPVVDDECRDDLLTIDGRPVSVRVEGRVPDRDDRTPLTVIGCQQVDLGPGEHRIEAAGRGGGLVVDRLVLERDRPDRPGRSARVRVPAPAVEVDERGRGRYEVTVAETGEPFWLVLGESFSDGWQASVDGGPDLGAPTLVDGFANGWRIDPAEVGSGPLSLSIEWTPNRIVRGALYASAAGSVAVVLLALGLGRRRAPVVVVPPLDGHGTVGLPPGTTAPPRAGLVLGSLAGGLLAGSLTRPWMGALFVVLALVAWWVRHGDRVVAAVAVGALATSGAYVTVQQWRFDPPHEGGWPALWDRAHTLGWVALVALGVVFVRSVVSARREQP